MFVFFASDKEDIVNLRPENIVIQYQFQFSFDSKQLYRLSNIIHRIGGDILYLDPPYNVRQYCTNYHVLETIARYDSPELKGKTGLRDYSNQKSLFCSSRTVVEAFDDVLRHADFDYIFLSYNNEGLMPFDVIQHTMEKYGEYQRFEQEYRRFKADKDKNRNIKANTTTEYLHCLIRK